MSLPPPPSWVPPPYSAAPPRHPETDKVLTLGLVGLVGGFVCYLPLLVAPVAWVVGNRVVREIRDSQGQLSGHDAANTGRILGIIGTALLLLGILAVIALVGLIVLVEVGASGGNGGSVPA